MCPLPVTFVGGSTGAWAIDTIEAVTGAPLAAAARLDVVEGDRPLELNGGPAWLLRGVTSNERYVGRVEHESLAAGEPPLGRPESTHAALIPVTKSEAWWDLPQDKRRRIFEEGSHHVAIGLEYLPQVARRLHHCRDLGEPFDFLTWFEFAPEHADAFDELVDRLRATQEWSYVVREVDVRLVREPQTAPADRSRSKAARTDGSVGS